MTNAVSLNGSGYQESIYDLINRLAETNPDGTYLINPENGTKISYSELKQKASTVAAYITSSGVEKGECVAFAMRNEPNAAIAILGIQYGGYLATSINLVAGKEVICYVLEHSETKLILANETGQATVLDALDNDCAVPLALIDDVLDNDLNGAQPTNSPKAGDDGLLMYTSGTTGRPKGVVLTHANLIAGGHNTALAHELTEKDTGLCVLPLYHINGLCVTVMGSLVSGGSLVVPPKFSVSTFWETIIKNKCSWFSVVPTQISYLLHDEAETPSNEALSNMRFGRSASAPLSPDVQEAFEKRFNVPIVETMGLTEAAAQILSNPLPPGVRKIASPGIAYGNEIVIGDVNQNELPYGEEGEVLVRGPNVMRLYLKNEEATSQAITPEGWLRTGDLGKMDKDGYVYITGRLKELIIKGGENIAPREIDEALYSHPDVIEAAAFSKKCDRYGETIEAAVMLEQSSSITESELKALCTSKIGSFKTPDKVHLMGELPKGPSGKIQRIKLAEIYN